MRWAYAVVGNSLSTGGASHDVGSIRESCEKRMIGDFDGSANALWTLYGKEAESHDKSRIQTLKDDMDGVLIFVCSHFVHPRNRADA